MSHSDFQNIYDPISNVMVEYLTVKDLVNFCKTSREYSMILADRNIWVKLLKRDFDSKSPNGKEEYQRLFVIKILRRKLRIWMERFVKSKKNLQEYLELFEILAFGLFDGDYPSLNHDLSFDPTNSSYIFLRRIITMFDCLPIDDIYRILDISSIYDNSPHVSCIVDQVIVRGRRFFQKYKKDPQRVADLIGKDQMLVSLRSILRDRLRNNLVNLYGFDKHPMSDPVLDAM